MEDQYLDKVDRGLVYTKTKTKRGAEVHSVCMLLQNSTAKRCDPLPPKPSPFRLDEALAESLACRELRSVCWSTHLLPTLPSFHPSNRHLPIQQRIHLYILLPAKLSTHHPLHSHACLFTHPPSHLSTGLSIHQSMRPSAHPLIHSLPTHPFLHLSAHQPLQLTHLSTSHPALTDCLPRARPKQGWGLALCGAGTAQAGGG